MFLPKWHGTGAPSVLVAVLDTIAIDNAAVIGAAAGPVDVLAVAPHPAMASLLSRTTASRTGLRPRIGNLTSSKFALGAEGQALPTSVAATQEPVLYDAGLPDLVRANLHAVSAATIGANPGRAFVVTGLCCREAAPGTTANQH